MYWYLIKDITIAMVILLNILYMHDINQSIYHPVLIQYANMWQLKMGSQNRQKLCPKS